MKKILVLILSLLLIFIFAGCNKDVSAEQITNDTKEAWDNSTQNETVEQLSFKNLSIGGIVKIDNLVFDIEKKFKDNKLFLNIETRKNMAIKIDENVKGIIDMVLDYKKLEGNLKVKHLEQAWSKVGLRANFEIDNNSVKGSVDILNVKDMFKENLAKPIHYDINIDNLSKNEEYRKTICALKCHPVSTFFPKNNGNFNISKETPVTFDSKDICSLTDSFICKNCDKKINESEFTLKHILFDTFCDTKAENIINNVIKLENPTAKFKLGSIDGKKYIDSMNVKSKIKVNISKSQLEITAKDLATVYKNEKLSDIYRSIISILNYDTALIEGDMDYFVTNRIIK